MYGISAVYNNDIHYRKRTKLYIINFDYTTNNIKTISVNKYKDPTNVCMISIKDVTNIRVCMMNQYMSKLCSLKSTSLGEMKLRLDYLVHVNNK